MGISLLHKPHIQNFANLDEQESLLYGIDLLWAEVTELRQKNKLLKQENQEFKKLNEKSQEKLRTNSKNSSKPPSQDPHRKKKKNSNLSSKPRKKKNQGGQKGHLGTARSLVPSSEVTSIEKCLPSACPCGGCLEIDMKNYQRHQQYELPKVEPTLTEYRIYKGICQECDEKYQGQLPPGTPTGMLGVRAMAQVAVLSGDYRISKREISRFLEDSFSLSVSLGTVSNTEARVSEALKTRVEEAKEYIQEQEVLHCDETGHKSERGNRFVERMMTVRTTCRQQNRNLMDYVTEAVQAHLKGESVPSLLPSEKRIQVNKTG